jgi:2-oxoglutarate dehydrogenase E2 component (dihydrolipoamide succinyltransferase)
MKIEIRTPAVGESVARGQIAAWLKKDGQAVTMGETLFELETEKASVSVPSPAEGRLEVLVQAGVEIAIGELVGYILAAGEAPRPAPEAPSPIPEASRPPPEAPRPTPEAPRPTPEAPRPTPEAPRPVPEAPRPRGEVRRSPLSMIRKTIARRLLQARHEAAHLTTFNEVDMSEVIKLREANGAEFGERYKAKLGYLSFFVKAAVGALVKYPVVNGRIEGDELVSPEFHDIGVAVATDRGLLVPVIRDADALSFGEIEVELAELARRAREGSIELAELQGGTFTITNGGVFGSLLSTPIPNYPQSAVLGLHAIQRRPVAIGDEIAIRPMMYLALTYDHRLIDGKEAVLFLAAIKESIENPLKLIFGL